MCDPFSATMAAVGAGSGMLDAKGKNKAWAAQETARRKNNIEAVRQANYADAALQLQDKANYSKARQELETISLDSIRATGTVATAIGESNLEGRTMERVARDVENSFLSSKVDTQRNYDVDYTNILGEREANRNQLIATIEGSAAAPKPGKLGQALGVVQGAVGGAAAGSQLQGVYNSSAKGHGKSQAK